MKAPSLMQIAVEVLTRPDQLVNRYEDPRAAGLVVGPLLSLLLLGAGLFGAVVGSFDGGWQLLYAGIKLPAVLLLAAVVSLPALRVLHAQEGRSVSAWRAGLAALVGCARVALLSTALAPLFWLIYSLDPPYVLAILMLVGGLSLVGLPGLITVARALSPAGSLRFGPTLATVGLLGLVMAQSGWILRPFVVTPGAELTVLCPLSGDVVSGLGRRLRGRVPVDDQGHPRDCSTRSQAAPQHQIPPTERGGVR
jgi:hypothetical protein